MDNPLNPDTSDVAILNNSWGNIIVTSVEEVTKACAAMNRNGMEVKHILMCPHPRVANQIAFSIVGCRPMTALEIEQAQNEEADARALAEAEDAARQAHDAKLRLVK